MPGLARAQAWPTHPVRFIVPLAAGGGLDFVARLTGDYLSRSIGQQVVVANMVGAGGLVGIEAAAKSAADGYTLLVTSDAIASTPHIVSFNVDYVRALVPVSHLARSPQTISVHPSLGVGTVAELVELARRQPGIGYATSGAGTNQNFLGEWFAQAAGIKLEHIPYRGAGQAINDLIAGHVRMAVLGPAAVSRHHPHHCPVVPRALGKPAGCADHRGGRRQGRDPGNLGRGFRARRNARRGHRAAQRRDAQRDGRSRRRREARADRL
jgi:tripartite-type tricarboxylate transporter receptor subunit TctC